jgi:pilus assembly protein Flp/PilA
MRNYLKQFLADESGATAIEYGLIAALIAVAIIVGASALGTNLNSLFNNVAGCIGATNGASGATCVYNK